ncbi:MAG TPA: carboxypeptidase-like regulatory domain-containing protein [Candidatus Woesearchaeota archaeon]|nr:carboxypeptidase-like regulatory domain-containing protein [Candidatus Woesearchaeota archaeon]
MKKLIIFLMVFLLLVNLGYSYELNSGEAKSKKDPLFIEMPEVMHQGLPYTIKVYINDPIVKKEAKYLEIGSSNPPYSTGSPIYFDSSGHFRQTMPYNGESVIEFGFRPSSSPGSKSTLAVGFYKTKKPSGEDYPDTSTPESEYYRYNCNIETNDLFCSDETGCRVCYLTVGSVVRSYDVSYSKPSIKLPSGFDFTDNIRLTEDGLHRSEGLSYSYSGKKTMTNSQGYDFTVTESYSIRTEFRDESWGYDTIRENVENFNKKANSKVNDISAPGGMTKGKAFEKITYSPFSEYSGYDDVILTYELYAQLDPSGSGLLTMELSRRTGVAKGEGEAEIQKIIEEAKEIASSYALSKDKVFKSESSSHHHNYEVPSKVEKEEITEIKIYGKIKDGLGNPMPYATITVIVKNSKFTGVTDENGEYAIDLYGMEFKESETKIPVKFYLHFDYHRDDKNYFSIVAKSILDGSQQVATFFTNGYFIEDFSDVKIDVDLSKPIDARTMGCLVGLQNLKPLSVIYTHSHEVIETLVYTLKLDVDYKLPVDIFVGNNQGRTLYSPGESDILIGAADAAITSENRPKNREYHEFSHHLMYAVYGNWPEGRLKAGVKNHGGFFNSNTADSYIEGFAEFMALVISDYLKQPEPEIYAWVGSLEEDYKPWDAKGRYEEIAVASLLWDMYDTENEEGDRLSFTFEEIWDVIKINRADFYEYYKAFKKTYPEKTKEIDDLFAKHGFFNDTRIGNKERDAGEPWKYISGNSGNYTFLDMSGNVTLIKYDKNLTIGPATNYERPNRTNMAFAEDSYIKIDDTNVDFYIVKVEHKNKDLSYEYETVLADGKIYVSPLPTGSDAVITVTPKSSKYTSAEPFEITAEEWNTLQAKGSDNGYIAKHDFELKDTGKEEEYKYERYQNTPPSYGFQGETGENHNYKRSFEISRDIKVGEPKTGGGFLVFLLLLIIFGAVIGGVYFYAKKDLLLKKTIMHKKNQAVNLGKSAKKGFVEKVIPWIKKTAKQIAEFTKKTYIKAKPEVIRIWNSFLSNFKKSDQPNNTETKKASSHKDKPKNGKKD